MNLGKENVKRGYKRVFVKNTLLSAAQQLISIVCTFFLLSYMIWRMGAEGYGLWIILKIFSIGGYFSFAEIGFHGSIVRYLTKFHAKGEVEKFQKLYLSGLILFFAIGLVCGGFLLLFGKYFFLQVFTRIPGAYAGQMKFCLAVYAVSFLFQFPSFVVKAYYTSRQDFFRLKLWETLNVIGFLILALVVLYFAGSIVNLVLVESVVCFVLFAFFLFIPFTYAGKSYSLSIRYLSFSSIKEVLGMNWYIFFNNISGIIYRRTPHLLIAYFLAPSYVTYYSIIDKIPRALKLFQGSINSAVLPLAVSFDTFNYRDKAKMLFLRGTRYSFVFSTPVVIFIFIFAADFLKVWVGQDYVFLANPLRVFVFWQYMMFLVAFGSTMYTREEHFRYLLPYTMVACIAFLLIGIFFIGRFGIWTILFAYLLSGLITISANMTLLHKIMGFTLWSFIKSVLLVPVFAGVLLCGAIASLLKIYAPSGNIFLLIPYVGIVYLLYLTFAYRYALLSCEKEEIGSILSYIRSKSFLGTANKVDTRK